MTLRVSQQEADLFLGLGAPGSVARRKYRHEESGVLAACIRWLVLHGCDVIRNNSGGKKFEYVTKAGVKKTYWVRFGKKDSGDILALGPTGAWIEVETKAPDGKLSEGQRKRQAEVEKRGGIYICARSTDDLDARKGELVG